MASMLSRPPRYGSAAAVHPSACAVVKPSPLRYLAVTGPAGVANDPGWVSAWLNGSFQRALRYSASVSTQPIADCDSEPGGSRLGMCPRVSAAIAALIRWRARSGSVSSGR